jgi:hypothetical protein
MLVFMYTKVLGIIPEDIFQWPWLIMKNSLAFSSQANYTDRATAACRRS